MPPKIYKKARPLPDAGPPPPVSSRAKESNAKKIASLPPPKKDQEYVTASKSSGKSDTLVRISAAGERERVLQEAGEILSNYENALLPTHGGRHWKTQVTVLEDVTLKGYKKGPLFRWYKGKLELALLPKYIKEIELRVFGPKYKNVNKPSQEQMMLHCDGDDVGMRNNTDKGNSTTLEATEDSIKVVFKRFWYSPDYERIDKFKKVVDTIDDLVARDRLIDKHIYGISVSGDFLQPKKVTQKNALEAGHARFLKDGLWVVGQEDSWQENNQRELQRMDALKVEKHKERDEVVAELEKGNDKSEIVTLDCGKRVIPCMYYVMRLRGQYRDKRVEEIKKATEAADSATPSVSVTAEPTEQSNEMDTSTDEPAAAVKTEKSDAKVTFTLKDSQKELRLIWSNNLTPEDKEAWKAEAIKQAGNQNFDSQNKTEKTTTNRAFFTLPAPGEEKVSALAFFMQETRDAHRILRFAELEKSAELSATQSYEHYQKNGAAGGVAPTSGGGVGGVAPVSEGPKSYNSFYKKPKYLLADSQKELRAIFRDVMDPWEREVWKKLAQDFNEKKKLAEEKKKNQAPIEIPTAITEVKEIVDETTGVTKIVEIVTPIDPALQKKEIELQSAQKKLIADNKEREYQQSLVNQQCRIYWPEDDKWQLAQCVKYDLETKLHTLQYSKKKFDEVDISKVKVIWENNRIVKKDSSFSLSEERCEMCLDAAVEHYERVMYTVNSKMLFQELQEGFDVLRERGFGRYDMTVLKYDEPEFSFLTDPNAPWMSIVKKCLGEKATLIHKGCFMSLPGAHHQVYHQDGLHLHKTIMKPCHAVNVFIPLLDMTKELGGTEFCLGTHILNNEGYVGTRCETPIGPMGCPYIFDYRTGHRGMGNSSDFARPVLYLTYSADDKFSDKVNFKERSYHKLGELLEKPLSREERDANRKKKEEGAAKKAAAATAKAVAAVADIGVVSGEGEGGVVVVGGVTGEDGPAAKKARMD